MKLITSQNVTKNFVKIGGVRYPRVAILTIFEENSYLYQYTGLNLFYKENVGEQLLNPYISYTDKKIFYPIQVTDFRFKVNHITAKKVQMFE